MAPFLGGCSLPPETVQLEIDVPLELVGDGAMVSVKPQIAEVRRRPGRGVVRLELRRDAGKVRLELPGACSELVDTRTISAERSGGCSRSST